MHHSTISVAALTLFQSLAMALPQYSFPGGTGADSCSAAANPAPEYENTSQVKTSGKPVQIGDSCHPTGKDLNCVLGRESSYSVAVTVTVGADIGLDFGGIASAGINAEVSIETSEGTTDTNQQECGGPWSCSMIVTPSVQEVAGTQHAWVGCPPEKKDFPYTVQFPIKNGDHLPVQHGEVCQCRNYPGFDEGAEDAPMPCPNDC